MRIAMLRITPELLGHLFFDREIHLRVESGLPEDAEFIMAKYNYREKAFELYYESKEFEDIKITTLDAPVFTTIPEKEGRE